MVTTIVIQSHALEDLLSELALIEFFPKKAAKTPQPTPENSTPIQMFVNPGTDRLLILELRIAGSIHLVPTPFLQASKFFEMEFTYGSTGGITIEILRQIFTERLSFVQHILDTQNRDDNPAKVFAFCFLMQNYPIGDEQQWVEQTKRLLGKDLSLSEMLHLAEYDIPEGDIKDCNGMPAEWLDKLYERFPPPSS